MSERVCERASRPDRPTPAHVISRRRFLEAVAAVAGTAAVATQMNTDRPDPPDRRLVARKIRWIGHI